MYLKLLCSIFLAIVTYTKLYIAICSYVKIQTSVMLYLLDYVACIIIFCPYLLTLVFDKLTSCSLLFRLRQPFMTVNSLSVMLLCERLSISRAVFTWIAFAIYFPPSSVIPLLDKLTSNSGYYQDHKTSILQSTIFH